MFENPTKLWNSENDLSFSMDFPWIFHGFSMDFPWTSIDFLLDFSGREGRLERGRGHGAPSE